MKSGHPSTDRTIRASMNEGILHGLIQSLLDSLGQELRQYGEILAIMDTPSDRDLALEPEQAIQSISSLREPMSTLRQARQKREICQNTIARLLGRTSDTSFPMLVPLLPEKFRLAVITLIQENDDLLHRVRQSAHHKSLVLRHSLELLHAFMTDLASVQPSSSKSVTEPGSIEATPPRVS